MSGIVTHYVTLCVTPCASADEIRSAFIELARVNHPDAGGSEEKMAELNRAYTTLKNDRKSYTLWLDMTLKRCSKCRGKGLIPSGFKGRKKCLTCDGVGYITKI